jgi:hypothetical protein
MSMRKKRLKPQAQRMVNRHWLFLDEAGEAKFQFCSAEWASDSAYLRSLVFSDYERLTHPAQAEGFGSMVELKGSSPTLGTVDQ